MIMPWRALLLLLAAQTTTQADIRYFAYERTVTVGNASGLDASGQAPSQACALLDPSVFAHARPGAGDLRLYSEGRQVPYILHVSSTPQPRQEIPEILNLGLRANTVTFDAEMPEGRYSTVHLDISARNFVTTVDVSGSASPAGVPATKLGAYTIFDLTGEKLGRSMVLHLPESNFRYLHFIVHSPIKPQDIGGITIVNAPLQDLVYSTISVSAVAKQESQRSVYTVDVPPNVPVDRIQFVPGETPVNFSRGVAVSWRPEIPGRNDSRITDLPEVEKGVIRRIHSVHNGHRIDDEQFSINPRYAADAVATRMAISVLNGDDAPIPLNAVNLQMRPRKLCFDATPRAQYTLYYGDSELAAPQYDYARLFQAEEHPAAATLGVEQSNRLFERRPDRRPLTERHPALIWAALLGVVALLGFVAWRTGRREAS